MAADAVTQCMSPGPILPPPPLESRCFSPTWQANRHHLEAAMRVRPHAATLRVGREWGRSGVIEPQERAPLATWTAVVERGAEGKTVPEPVPLRGMPDQFFMVGSAIALARAAVTRKFQFQFGCPTETCREGC